MRLGTEALMPLISTSTSKQRHVFNIFCLIVVLMVGEVINAKKVSTPLKPKGLSRDPCASILQNPWFSLFSKFPSK